MSDKQKSIIAMLLSALAFSLMGVFVKVVGDISVIQKAIFRSSTIMILSFIMLRTNSIPIFGIKHHKLLFLRSLFGTFGILFNYYAIDHLILSDANIIFRLSTIFLILFSWIFLREKINSKQFITILTAFVGVFLIIKPEFSVEIIPYIIAILGAGFAALAYTTLRVLGQKEHTTIIVFFFSFFTTIVLMPYVIINYEPMTWQQVIYAILAGICAGIGQLGVTIAYKLAPAKEVSIYNYFGVVFSAVFSIALFGNVPDTLSIIGYIIIFGTSYYMYIQTTKRTALSRT